MPRPRAALAWPSGRFPRGRAGRAGCPAEGAQFIRNAAPPCRAGRRTDPGVRLAMALCLPAIRVKSGRRPEPRSSLSRSTTHHREAALPHAASWRSSSCGHYVALSSPSCRIRLGVSRWSPFCRLGLELCLPRPGFRERVNRESAGCSRIAQNARVAEGVCSECGCDALSAPTAAWRTEDRRPLKMACSCHNNAAQTQSPQEEGHDK